MDPYSLPPRITSLMYNNSALQSSISMMTYNKILVTYKHVAEFVAARIRDKENKFQKLCIWFNKFNTVYVVSSSLLSNMWRDPYPTLFQTFFFDYYLMKMVLTDIWLNMKQIVTSKVAIKGHTDFLSQELAWWCAFFKDNLIW